jgi:hypothetical protein
MQTYAVVVPINHNWTVSFPEHLAQLRKERGFTQPQLAAMKPELRSPRSMSSAASPSLWA